MHTCSNGITKFKFHRTFYCICFSLAKSITRQLHRPASTIQFLLHLMLASFLPLFELDAFLLLLSLIFIFLKFGRCVIKKYWLKFICVLSHTVYFNHFILPLSSLHNKAFEIRLYRPCGMQN